ncbi:MAG: AIR carboxylase family protein [Spirochaetales bacterium]|nr:AIR carboxylase family protein [Spirochaetales bacterium]
MKDILFITGSESDKKNVEAGIELIKEKQLSYEFHVFSAHRNLDALLAFLKDRGAEFKVIIAAAGLSAALPGIIAAKVSAPVIGVPLVAGHLGGIDALLSILQLPKGIPVATMGIGTQGVLNAVHLAERIIRIKGKD